MTAGGHIQFNRIAPAQHREQITIGDGEAMAGQPLFIRQRGIDVLQFLLEQRAGNGLIVFRGVRAEQRRKAFMQFGSHVVQPFQGLVTGNGAHGRQQMAVRHLIGDVLHNSHALGEQDVIIQQQRRHLTFRVDQQIIFPVFQLFPCQIHALQSEIQAAFAQGDV